MISEIFPNRLRSLGMSVAVCAMWTANFLVTQTFPMINENPYLLERYHGAFPMWLFAGCCAFGYWFVTRFVPETRGVALERIEGVMLDKLRPSKRQVLVGNRQPAYQAVRQQR